MDQLMKQKYLLRSNIIKALSHPSRLMIIDELQKGPRCVCELQTLVGSDMSTVSKHLSILKSAGLLYDVKQGTAVYYHLQMQCVTEFFFCIDRVIEHIASHQVKIAQCCTRKTEQ